MIRLGPSRVEEAVQVICGQSSTSGEQAGCWLKAELWNGEEGEEGVFGRAGDKVGADLLE